VRITSIDLIQVDIGSKPGFGVGISPTGRVGQRLSERPRPHYEQFLRVRTDEGIEGIATGGNGYLNTDITIDHLGYLRDFAIGADPLDRERLFQALHRGGRFLYVRQGWLGPFDNCLWDIAGKVAGLPIHKLIGQVRESIPAYAYVAGHPTRSEIERDMLRNVDWARETMNVPAFKVGVRQDMAFDIGIFRAVRKHVGDDFTLMMDGGSAYSLREAKEIGLALEELGYEWYEEPMYEQEMRWYKELKRGLTRIPIMATEMLMYDMNISAQWALEGATDLLRANGHFGATGVLKLAHFAELLGTRVELNSFGGLGGHISVQLQCAIANTGFYEHLSNAEQVAAGVTLGSYGRSFGITNAPEIVDGHIKPSMEPGWGAVIDWDFVNKHTVEVL
jgi:L-alanine-DL-glutamate epimerase-like enolase superfamily enzyme